MTIVGAFLGEDSVQSGGEFSLDSATIIARFGSNEGNDDGAQKAVWDMRFSKDIFDPTKGVGMKRSNDLMQAAGTIKKVVAIIELQ